MTSGNAYTRHGKNVPVIRGLYRTAQSVHLCEHHKKQTDFGCCFPRFAPENGLAARIKFFTFAEQCDILTVFMADFVQFKRFFVKEIVQLCRNNLHPARGRKDAATSIIIQTRGNNLHPARGRKPDGSGFTVPHMRNNLHPARGRKLIVDLSITEDLETTYTPQGDENS